MRDFTFDPWPIVQRIKYGMDAGCELTEMQALSVKLALQIEDGPRPSTGYEVLMTVSWCVGNGIPVPYWLALEFGDRLRQVSSFEARSLDDPAAFGPTPIKANENLRGAALRWQWAKKLEMFFSTSGPFRRTDDGYRAAAEALGLSVKQVRTLLPKTRKNTSKGRKPSHGPARSVNAHNPFGLGREKGPKS